MRTARILKFTGGLFIMAAILLPLPSLYHFLSRTFASWQTFDNHGDKVSPDQEIPHPQLSPLERARQAIPGELTRIYRALNDGNPKAIGDILSAQIAGSPRYLDQICRPYTYRAHYIEAVIQRPTGQFEARVRELSQSMDEAAYTLVFQAEEAFFVLVDVQREPEDWLAPEKSQAINLARQFIYGAMAGRKDVLGRLVSPNLDTSLLFTSDDYVSRLRETTSITDGPTAGLTQRVGLKIAVHAMSGRKQICGDMWNFLVDQIGHDYRIVQWEFTPIFGCYRFMQPPSQTKIEDPNLEHYTLVRFGLAAEPNPSAQSAELQDSTDALPKSDNAASNGHPNSAIIPPSIQSRTEPEMSDEARRANFTGVVLVSVLVDEDGDPHDPRLINPPGLGLDTKIIEAVQQWKFSPRSRQSYR